MKRYENEQFKVDEVLKFEEYKHFKAEDFKSLELLSVDKEEFKVDEIQKQSFVSHKDNSEGKKEKKENKIFDKLKSKIMSSSTSASISTSIGTTGALITAGIVGAGVVLSPVLDLPLFQLSYGTLELINYRVETTYENDEPSKIITIYFNEQLKEGYEGIVVNNKTQESEWIDPSLDQVTFKYLNDELYDFDMIIIDSSEKIIDSKNFIVTTVGSIPYVINHEYELLVTYNEDETFNLYYYPKYEYKDNQIKLEVALIDYSGNQITCSEKEIDNLYCFEDIQIQEFDIYTKAYVIDDGNEYLIHNEHLTYESPNSFDYDVDVSEEEVYVEIFGNLSSDIYITLTYLDDNSKEEYVYSKEDWYRSVTIPLTKKTEIVDVNIKTSTKHIYSTNTNFVAYKGNIDFNHNVNETLETNVVSNISLESIEMYSGKYVKNEEARTTILTFDGYIRSDAYYKVKVYDLSNQLLHESDDIYTLNTPVIIYDLPTDQTLKFDYVVYDNEGNEMFANDYQISLTIPEDFSNAVSNIYFNTPNPGEITRTFNEDGTLNFYFYTAFENNSGYDAKAMITLYSEGVGKSQISDEKVVAFENLSPNKTYTVEYDILILNGMMRYIFSDIVNPSGAANEDRTADGMYYRYISAYQTDIAKQYEVDIIKQAYSDLSVKVLFDTGQTHEFTVLQQDIIDNKFTVDLSQFEFNNASIEVSGLLDMSYSRQEILDAGITMKGNVYIYAKAFCDI